MDAKNTKDVLAMNFAGTSGGSGGSASVSDAGRTMLYL